eukprot:TRINITY_DN41931_c0_g1_i1.p1 TRINITY_DN41931_c0_g1~~TRINITY_DN41931_c0_g1_i1.p1  ORF type:complete len:613 (-),score=104.03 TRINITY_DN41931_c0_g1_i1:229-2022(-)
MAAGDGNEAVLRDELRKLREHLRDEIKVMLNNQTVEIECLIRGSSVHDRTWPAVPSVTRPSVPGVFLPDDEMDSKMVPQTSVAWAAGMNQGTAQPHLVLPSSPSPRPEETPEAGGGGRRLSAMFLRPSEGDVDDADTIKVAGGIFGADTKKEHQILDQAIYDVANFYKTTGFSQHLARSETFEKVTLLVIAINALYIGIDAELNKAETMIQADPPFIVCDNLFCLFFTFELAIRFAAFRYKSNCLRDTWFVFDSFLVALMVAETWLLTCILLFSGVGASGGGPSLPTGPLRLLRLLRLSRLVRLLRAMPELLVLVNGIKVASRAVWSSLLMIFMMNYVVAIMLHMFLKDRADLAEQFKLLTLTMWTLFMDGTFMDSTRQTLDQLRYVARTDPLLSIFGVTVFVLYILMTNITVMNMLIGILCQVVSEVKSADDEKTAIQLMQQYLRDMLVELDTDKNGQISRSELAEVVKNKTAVRVLEKLDVNPMYVMDLTEKLFEEDIAAGRVPEVTREELMEVILKVRGNRNVAMQDLVEVQIDLRRLLCRSMNKIDELLSMRGETIANQGTRLPATTVLAASLEGQPSAFFDGGGADDGAGGW